MAGPSVNITGILLQVTPRERFTRWEVFAADHGVIGISVPVKKALPFGLFDTVEIHAATKGKSHFADDVVLLSRPSALARTPVGFTEAATLGKLILTLFATLPDYAPIYDIFQKSLTYYAEGHPPTLVTLKALYKMLAAEGFPVGGDWLDHLPAALRTDALACLEAPLAKDSPIPSEAALASLIAWAQRELGTTRR